MKITLATLLFLVLQMIWAALPGRAWAGGASNGRTWANTQDCIDPDAGNQILKDFAWSSNDGSPGVDFCDADSAPYRVVKALLLLQTIPELPRSENGFSAKELGDNPDQYFRSRIHQIVMESGDANSVCKTLGNQIAGGADPAYGVISYYQGGQTLHVCPYAATLAVSNLLLNLIHEARHADGSQYNHVHCQQGFWAGKDQVGITSGMCDANFADQGSYGIETALAISLSNSAFFNPVLQKEFRSNAVYNLFQHFNQLPLHLRAGALMQEGNGTISFYDGARTEKVAQEPNTLVTLIDNSLSLFRIQSGQILSLGTGFPFATDLTTEAPLSFTSAVWKNFRASILDVNQIDDATCYLTPTRLYCEGPGGAANIQLSSFKAIKFLRSIHSNIFGQNQLLITAEDGFSYTLPSTLAELKKTDPAQFAKTDTAYKAAGSMIWLDNQELMLSLNGSVYIYSYKENAWNHAPATPTDVKNMIGPVFWSPALKDL